MSLDTKPNTLMWVDMEVYDRIRRAIKANDRQRAVNILRKAADISGAQAGRIIDKHLDLLSK